MNLEDAIACLKAHGYRVTKPGKPRKSAAKDRVGPTFVATFADDQVVRMSCCCSDDNLNWTRGEALARAAYEARWRRVAVNRPDDIVCHVPAIADSWFERDGVRLGQCGR